MLGLASCQNDFDGANVGVGGEVDFQLSVNAPELATRAGLDGVTPDGQADLNSAYGAIDYLQANDEGDATLRTDWSDVNLRYTLEVYDVDENGNLVGEAPYAPVKDRQVIIVDEYKPVTFELRLVPKRHYRFVVFADFVPETVTDATQTSAIEAQKNIGSHHVIGNTLADIKVKNDGINDECSDAYFGYENFTITDSRSNDIVLKRPYGKLRVIATDLHELNLNVNPKKVKVAYTAPHLTNFDAVTGAATLDKQNTEVEFDSTYNDVYKEADKGGLQNHFYTTGYDALNGANHEQYTNANGAVRHTHMTLFTDYILANNEVSPVHFTMTVYDRENKEIKSTTFNTDIPVQRNYLTTVIGNVLTTATEVEVRIDDNFAGEIVVDADIEDQLEEAAKKKNYVIDLDGDFIWETGAAHGSNPLIPKDAITETLTINGNGYKFIATGTGVGAIRLANGGKLILNNLTVVDQSEYHYEKGETAWEFTYLEFAGKTEFNNCVIDNTIAIDGEEAVFNNCTFNDKVTWPSNAGQEYAAWVSNGKAYFNNCSFSGARGIKVHEYYGTEVEEVVVDNCQFNNLSKKPGMAIGTLNADTKIAIKNSTFTNCQPGDQGLYIYETDTDVTTFDFTQTDNTVTAAIATSEEFAKITKADIHTLNIALAGDITVDVSAHIPSYYFGGKNTNVITIDGAKAATTAATGAGDNTYTLTFNHKNTDWNYIRFNNDDAKWVIKNVKITNSGANNGPWNRHDIRFFNDVVLENVTSDKAIALLANGDLTNVIISDVHPNNSEAYALWITAEGQTVNLKNCALLAHESKTTDRGIKIDNQYVNEGEAKVTLNIDGLKVKSQEKAAIMVKSTKGADINIKNIDITEVAADKVNAVWVDEDTKQYAGLVTVTGASMVVEGVEPIEGETPEDIQAKLNAAVTVENAVVQLPAGEYTFPKNFAKGVTVICEEGTVFKGNHSLDINGAIINGGTFTADSGRTVTGTVNATLRGCTFEGGNALRYCYTGENCVFEECVFDGVTYGAHFDGGDYPLTFIRCTFSGFNAFGSKIPQLTMIDCVFKSTGKSGYNGANLWGTTTMTNTTFIFDGSASTEWIGLNAAGSNKVIALNDCTVTNGSVFDYFANWKYGYKVTVDGVVYEFVADGVMKVDEVYEISSKAGMFWFANEVNVNNNSFAGKTVKLAANIDLENADWEPIGQTGATTFNGVFDGQNYTIYNLNVDSEAQTGGHYSSGLFGWVESHSANQGHLKNVKIDGATIVGHHNCGALVGYITQGTALVENCHVTDAAISCTVANEDANGDKAGALIGNATVATPVKNCTASDSTVSSGRDAGQVIGAGREANVTGCSATNVTVEANGTGTGANVRNEVIGRLL